MHEEESAEKRDPKIIEVDSEHYSDCECLYSGEFFSQ